jgi:hypothetical protein
MVALIVRTRAILFNGFSDIPTETKVGGFFVTYAWNENGEFKLWSLWSMCGLWSIDTDDGGVPYAQEDRVFCTWWRELLTWWK